MFKAKEHAGAEMDGIHSFLGTFRDPVQETAFREHKYEANRKDASITMLVPVGVILLFAFSDFINFGISSTFSGVMIFRMVYALFTIGMVYTMWRNADLFIFDVLLSVWALMTDVFSISISLSRPPDYYHYLIMDILVLVFVYTILPVRMSFKVPVVLLMSTFEIWAVYAYKEPWSDGVAFATYAAFGTVNVLGFLVARRANINERTEFRRLKAEVQLKEKWEKMVAEQTGLVERLEKADALNQRLFTIIGRDLNSMFREILTLADEGKRGFASLEEMEVQLNETVHQSHELVGNLLTWSRLQTNDLTYQPVVFDLSDVMKQVISEKQDELARKNGELQANIPDNLLIIADREMIKRVLDNLISNAIKFSPAGGKVSISLSGSNFSAFIQISDQGAGMPADFLAAYNEGHFPENDDPSATSGSSGLGLILCKGLIKLHNGHLVLSNRPEGGMLAEVLLSHA